MMHPAAPEKARPALVIRGISKTFHAGTEQEIRALRSVSLELSAGAFVLVLGGNGSGKSTLLNAVAGSFPVDEGLIEIEGKTISGSSPERRAAFLGRVFQDPFAGTAPTLTVAENLSLAMKRGARRGLDWATGRQRMDACRDRLAQLRMGLEARMDQPMGLLSGGQRQAITLLMATWIRPSVLLLDEHTAALDPRSAETVLTLTEMLVRRDQLTTLMVTHSLNQASQLGDRLIVMREGMIQHDLDCAQKASLSRNDFLNLYA